MKTTETTIQTVDLTTGYSAGHKESIVSSNLNASLRSGKLACLLGPNGAGKSTLLRTLSGFQKPLSGEVRLLGADIASYHPTELAKMLSVVLTDKPVLENMDVESLVGLGRTPYTDFWGHMKDSDRAAVENAMKLTGIERLRHRMVQTLSDGERQKTMIAKAFAQDTPVIFLDEPTAFLDYPSKVEIMLLLRELAREQNKTIFMSTHDLEIALQIADDIWLIDKELGVRTGTHSELADSGELKRYFMRPGIRFNPSDGLFKIDL